MNLNIQDLNTSELDQFSELIISIYQLHIKRYYSEEGNEDFMKYALESEMLKRIKKGNKIMKVTLGDELIGVFEFDKKNLLILFILDDFRGKGYSRMIINWIKDYMLEHKWGNSITALVSPNAYKAYEKLGFKAANSETEEKGKVLKKMKYQF